MTSETRPFAGCALLLLSLSLGCQDEVAGSAPSGGGASDSAPVRVSVAKPQRKDLQLISRQPGWIEAYEETPLAAKVSGYVATVSVDIGDKVEAGDVLMRLSAPELNDDLRQKGAGVVQSQAEVVQAEAGVRAASAAAATARARVAQARAGITRSQGELVRAQSEHARMESLAAGGSVTRQLLDEAGSRLSAATATRQEADAGVELAEAAVSEGDANVQKAEADLAASQARLKVAEAVAARAATMLAYTEIKAPYAGVVTRRHADTGQFVPAAVNNDRPLLVVSRQDRVRAVCEIPEIEAAFVNGGEQGDIATIRSQALPGREFEFPITRTGWSLDSSNRSLRTEIELINDEQLFRPGMYLTIEIVLEEREQALTLPATAVFRDGGQTRCCVVAQGKIVRTPVATGLRTGADIEVLSGLSSDAQVVQARAASLAEGQVVELIEAAPK